MEYTSVFDIMGPIMVGPSSSHTAGALGISRFAYNKFNGTPTSVKISLYNSFAKTYKGHGTDVALIAGLLGFQSDDLRIPVALEIAKEIQLDYEIMIDKKAAMHPNTVKLLLTNEQKVLEVIGISIGGGCFKILSEIWCSKEMGENDV